MKDTFQRQTISVLGAGYVGLTTAALLAHAGFKVYVIEPNKERLSTIQKGKSFFYEAGLDILISTALRSKNLIATDNYNDSVAHSSVVFSCVGTPDNPDGSSNLRYVYAAAEEAAKHMKPDTIYVQKSTVPVGTGKEIEEIFTRHNKAIDYVSNPEFLREATAVYDTLYFDRVVAGSNNTEATDHILDIYRELEECRDDIANLSGVSKSRRAGQYISTGLNSAELIKVTSNAFLALKISFANSIAKLSDAVGADIVEVMDAVGADERIGRAFLNAGRGYGGGCFPKDVSGLISSGLDYGVDLEIMHAAQFVNDTMPGYILEKLQNSFGGTIKGKNISVLGLSFKAGTSDTRRSPGITIANTLIDEGATVTAFDPVANEEATHELVREVHVMPSLQDAIKNSDAIIITTEWAEFVQLHPDDYKRLSSAEIIVDAINRLDPSLVLASGLHYIGVGR